MERYGEVYEARTPCFLMNHVFSASAFRPLNRTSKDSEIRREGMVVRSAWYMALRQLARAT